MVTPITKRSSRYSSHTGTFLSIIEPSYSSTYFILSWCRSAYSKYFSREVLSIQVHSILLTLGLRPLQLSLNLLSAFCIETNFLLKIVEFLFSKSYSARRFIYSLKCSWMSSSLNILYTSCFSVVKVKGWSERMYILNFWLHIKQSAHIRQPPTLFSTTSDLVQSSLQQR